ncbi:hypothetical protein RA272_23140 [Pseudomonas syringae pv. tagetis]|uniref:Uncharacterized protein n=1 Tax=Pseudomonas syringae pv. tagetis TaxID=129140 RepID=A0A0Q0BJ84_9PSED|nr:Uncharacterized protein ALO44_04232 [Pseudomonas syringae pv. tagetis]RMW17058.1 hypothetical protein ALO97_04466 [Pseudomonas syringae pv. tagetis]
MWGSPITVADLIDCIQFGATLKDNLCLCVNNDVDVIAAETICYLDYYPEVVNDKGVYSEFVAFKGLQLLYYEQQFNDVLMNASSQKKPWK